MTWEDILKAEFRFNDIVFKPHRNDPEGWEFTKKFKKMYQENSKSRKVMGDIT